MCQGRTRPDGHDYRVLDGKGQPVPFQVLFHDANRYSLLAFRASNPKQTFTIYFGNPKADRAAEEVVVDPAPGAGPPKGDWVPHHYLVLTTIERPKSDNPPTSEDEPFKDDNPKTIAELAKMLQASPHKHGARFQRRIADGYNSFGSSDYYMSIYRGWINIPKDGTYQFCTISNEASFSFLDGKDLVHWPGRHTVERGKHGEKNVAVQLTKGLHYIEYYHEEVLLEQMAYLGWRPSADKGPFSPIPESVYTAPHEAVVKSYEQPKGPLLTFEPVITDSVWPAERSTGQYTRCHLKVPKEAGLPEGTTYRWDFGDGQTAAGPEVEHVYLTLETFPVTLTAEGPKGTLTARWPFEVFLLEHVTNEFKEGRLPDYARMARGYQRDKLPPQALKELAYLLSENEEPAESLEVCRLFRKRFPDGDAKLLAEVNRLAADCALRLGKEAVDEAIASYQASITKDTPPAEKLEILGRLIRLLGVERGLTDKAAGVLAQVEEVVKTVKLDEETLAAYRKALIAAGDVSLWHGKLDAAAELYQRAEKLGRFIPMQVRAARVGAYPETLRDFISNGNLGAALDLVQKWEDTFPTDKIKGQTLFWRGKLMSLRGQAYEASRLLARAVSLAPGAMWETEGRWLLAEALEKQGRTADARRELARLVAIGNVDEFTRRAREKLGK